MSSASSAVGLRSWRLGRALAVLGSLAGVALVALVARAARADDASDALDELKRGYALKQSGDCAQAVIHFERSLQLSSTAKALLNLSDCEARMGRLEAAREHAAAGRTLAGLQGDAELVSVADHQLAIIDQAQSSPVQPGLASPGASAAAPAPPGDPGPRRIAWFAVGALSFGVVGLAIGAGAGVAADSKHATLAGECTSNGACPASSRGTIDDFHTLKTWSTVGYAVGAAGLIGAGVAGILWLVRPGTSQTGLVSRLVARAWIGVGSAGVAGSF